MQPCEKEDRLSVCCDGVSRSLSLKALSERMQEEWAHSPLHPRSPLRGGWQGDILPWSPELAASAAGTHSPAVCPKKDKDAWFLKCISG